MPRGTRRKEMDATIMQGDLAEVAGAWSRLSDSQRTKFLAAILRDAMTKPAAQSELLFWISVLQDWEASAVASLSSMTSDG
jgi:hypothetical protein